MVGDRPGGRAARVASIAAVVALLAVVVPGVAGSAYADTTLIGASPAPGEIVTTPVTSVTLDFQNRIVGPAFVIVMAPDGSRVDAGEPVVVDTRVQQAFETSGNGRYTVMFRAIAEDGHPAEGTHSFLLRVPPSAGFWSRYGAQVGGFGLLLGLVVIVGALRLRAGTSSASASRPRA